MITPVKITKNHCNLFPWDIKISQQKSINFISSYNLIFGRDLEETAREVCVGSDGGRGQGGLWDG